MTALPRNRVLVGDAAARLREVPAGSIDCCITSPPYFQLRNYAVPGQLGLEPNVDDWVQNLRVVMAEVARILKPSGSLWLNLGDSYSRHPRYGAAAKSLLCGPERLLLALVADGWIVRNKVVWAKPNAMPHSVSDRLNASHEVMYFLVRSRRYFFDLDRIRVAHRSRGGRKPRPEPIRPPGWAGPLAGSNDGLRRARPHGLPGHPLGKNPGDVWAIATSGYRGAHFATFPEALVERPLLATCPKLVCTTCRTPQRTEPGRLQPTCGCKEPSTPGIVVDPFFGAGTVGLVAQRHGRDWLGVELNPAYVDLARARLGQHRTRYERAVTLLSA